MANIAYLSDEQLNKKINSAKVAIERNTGAIKQASERKLAKLEAELESRGSKVEKEVKEDVKKVEKEVKKEAKKVEKAVEKKPATKEKTTKKKKRPRVYGSPTEKFTLTIDGQTFKFDDLKSKQECERAKKAVEARYKETKEHKAATKAGIARSKTVSVTQRISDGFASIAKKAVSEVPATKIERSPAEIKKELEAVEKAFDNLFDKLGELMGKEIPKTQRKKIMDILTKFEDKMEKGKDKKSVATAKVRKKEDGGFASSVDDSWSYASFM